MKRVRVDGRLQVADITQQRCWDGGYTFSLTIPGARWRCAGWMSLGRNVMRYEIEFVEGQVPDALVSISGEMTIEGNRAWLAELVGDARWRPGMKTLVDGTGLEPGDFASGDVREVAETTVADDAAWGAGFSAVVVSNPAIYGLLRIWQMATSDMEWQTDIFYSRDEALAWLVDAD
jgi:hypothetical protein